MTIPSSIPDRNPPFHSVFQEVFDVVIIGAGYAGFAAAQSLIKKGKRALLMTRQPALLWENGWAMSHKTGDSNSPLWKDWISMLSQHHAYSSQAIDGAIAEVIATEYIHTASIPTLYFVAPISVELESGKIRSIIVGSKGQLHRIVAKQWLDATETGEILHLLALGWKTPRPHRKIINLFFRHQNWPEFGDVPLLSPELRGAVLRWKESLWPKERILQVELPETFEKDAKSAWIPALKTLSTVFPTEMKGALLTHGSVVPFPCYRPSSEFSQWESKLPSNLAISIPGLAANGCSTLGERFDSGLESAHALLGKTEMTHSSDVLSEKIILPEGIPSRYTNIVVAGTGTAGALAALSAGLSKEKVIAVDSLPFCGGIGSGGGIHLYYYGVTGGLQDELDVRTRESMSLFGTSSQIQGFHPDAKKIILDEMLLENGVQILRESILVQVECHNHVVTSALIATPEGPLKISAKAWIDSTGDGDLAAIAGAPYSFGRATDGLFHAYSQSSGTIATGTYGMKMEMVNFDAGFVDPTDPEDLTRARLVGIRHYFRSHYSEDERPTYIAPALGLRQSRHIVTEYILTLADLIERRTFPDSIGYTGCHYDNHATDYELESIEGLFWVWVCRQWKGRTACEIPYRILLPKNLDNVWIACRALGVTPDAHASLRMQRDMQRVGEVAGFAAVLSVKHQCKNSEIPMEDLKKQLIETGALKFSETKEQDPFGPTTREDSFSGERKENAPVPYKDWIQELQSDPPSSALWYLYRSRKGIDEIVCLLSSRDRTVSWKAACLLALWNDSRGEKRLCEAIEEKEYGCEASPEKERPEYFRFVAPHWLIAISLLRECGTLKSLPVFLSLVNSGDLLLNVRTSLALACKQIGLRERLGVNEIGMLEQILSTLSKRDGLNAINAVQKNILSPSGEVAGNFRSSLIREDSTWQLDLCIHKTREALGLPNDTQLEKYRFDSRRIVRRAFSFPS